MKTRLLLLAVIPLLLGASAPIEERITPEQLADRTTSITASESYEHSILDDRDAALAEVERLLAGAGDDAQAEIDALTVERDDLAAQVALLQSQTEVLQAQLALAIQERDAALAKVAAAMAALETVEEPLP